MAEDDLTTYTVLAVAIYTLDYLPTHGRPPSHLRRLSRFRFPLLSHSCCGPGRLSPAIDDP